MVKMTSHIYRNIDDWTCMYYHHSVSVELTWQYHDQQHSSLSRDDDPRIHNVKPTTFSNAVNVEHCLLYWVPQKLVIITFIFDLNKFNELV